tara:strand:+ start:454 stop:684 length:231 start_codon:yes stop_codon:yes gene_type:complete
MYSTAESMTISYLNTLNKLKELEIDQGNTSVTIYKIKNLIRESINEIEKIGGKVRLTEGKLLSLVELNEYKQVSRL